MLEFLKGNQDRVAVRREPWKVASDAAFECSRASSMAVELAVRSLSATRLSTCQAQEMQSWSASRGFAAEHLATQVAGGAPAGRCRDGAGGAHVSQDSETRVHPMTQNLGRTGVSDPQH